MTTTSRQPSRYQAINNARIALGDQLPPAYAVPLQRITNSLADRITAASVWHLHADTQCVAALDLLAELLEEIGEALTTQARRDPALVAVARAELAAVHGRGVVTATGGRG